MATVSCSQTRVISGCLAQLTRGRQGVDAATYICCEVAEAGVEHLNVDFVLRGSACDLFFDEAVVAFDGFRVVAGTSCKVGYLLPHTISSSVKDDRSAIVLFDFHPSRSFGLAPTMVSDRFRTILPSVGRLLWLA